MLPAIPASAATLRRAVRGRRRTAAALAAAMDSFVALRATIRSRPLHASTAHGCPGIIDVHKTESRASPENGLSYIDCVDGYTACAKTFSYQTRCTIWELPQNLMIYS